MTLAEFVRARLTEDEMHAQKDIWCTDRASAGWEAHPGYNLPYSNLVADGQVIARFTGTRGLPLADGEDDQHQADLMLAARMGAAAKRRAERMLREIAAKREILTRCETLTASLIYTPEIRAARDALTDVVELFATAWSDHPDYDQEWAP